MAQSLLEHQCPCCGSKKLKPGKLGNHKHTFIPEERQFMWIGYHPKAFVCLDCGFLGHYLDEADITEIRNQS